MIPPSLLFAFTNSTVTIYIYLLIIAILLFLLPSIFPTEESGFIAHEGSKNISTNSTDSDDFGNGGAKKSAVSKLNSQIIRHANSNNNINANADILANIEANVDANIDADADSTLIPLHIPRSAGHTLLLLCMLAPQLLLLASSSVRALWSCTRIWPQTRTFVVYAIMDVLACVGVGLLCFFVAPKLDVFGKLFLGILGGIIAPAILNAGAAFDIGKGKTAELRSFKQR